MLYSIAISYSESKSEVVFVTLVSLLEMNKHVGWYVNTVRVGQPRWVPKETKVLFLIQNLKKNLPVMYCVKKYVWEAQEVVIL